MVAESLVSAGLATAAAAHLGDLVLLVAGRGGGLPSLQGAVDAARVPAALATRLVGLEAGLGGCERKIMSEKQCGR